MIIAPQTTQSETGEMLGPLANQVSSRLSKHVGGPFHMLLDLSLGVTGLFNALRLGQLQEPGLDQGRAALTLI